METLVGTSYRKENFLQYYINVVAGAAGAAMGGQLASSAGAAGSAVAGGAVAAGNFALTQAGNAVKNMSIIMIILGTFQFLLRPILGDSSSIIFVLSLVLFVMAGYALAEKVQVDRIVVFFPMLIFCVWYFYFKANYMPSFLIYFLTISAFVLIIIDVVTKGKGIQPELYGFIPVVFFFLDIGLIPFLIDTIGLPITDLVQSLVLFMPWWAFFGIMTFPIDTTDKESKINALMRILHVLGVIYIVFVFLLPMIPTVGYDSNSLVPDASTFASTQEEYREQLSGTENPIVSYWHCFKEGRMNDLAVCIEERKEAAEISADCHNQGYDEGSSAHDECVAKVYEDQENWENSADGQVSSDLDQHVDIEITKGGYFDDEIKTITENKNSLMYPVEVRIENPLEKEFEIDVACNFEGRGRDDSSVTGIVSHGLLDEEGSMLITESDEYEFICSPTENLNGDYNLELTMDFNMQTHSYLKRAVVEQYDEENPMRDATQYQLLSAFFSGDGKNGDAYYADEFVAINFAIGEKIIELDDYPVLSSNIENIGDGTITEIVSYSLELGELEIQGDDDSCAYGQNTYIEEDNNEGDSVFLGSCFVSFESVEDTVEDYGISFHNFIANVDYKYQIKGKFRMEVDIYDTVAEEESTEEPVEETVDEESESATT